MKQVIYYPLLILLSVFLLACEPVGTVRPDDDSTVDDQIAGDTGDFDDLPDDTIPFGDCEPPCEFPRSAINDPDSPLAQRLIFFDYDKSDIKPEYESVIENHGRYLAANPDMKVRLEGHTDERGSREYNLALGEQRAQSIRKLLLFHGAQSDSINVVSFGEELPLDLGHDESAWSQNRRVELVYESN